jgi:hypothetical protein
VGGDRLTLPARRTAPGGVSQIWHTRPTGNQLELNERCEIALMRHQREGDARRCHRVLFSMRDYSGLIRRGSLAVLVAALSACNSSGPGGPRQSVPAGTYVMTSVNGHAPAVTTDSSAHEWGQIIADTLIFVSDTKVQRHLVIRRVDTVYGSDNVYRPMVELEYRLDGERIEMGSFSPCPDLCVRNDVGTYSPGDGSISLTTYWYGAAPLVRFARVEALQ